MKIYLIVEKVQGAAGHGEPGPKWFALDCDSDYYTRGTPKPAYATREAAQRVLDKKDFDWCYEIVELDVNGFGLDGLLPLFRPLIDKMLPDDRRDFFYMLMNPWCQYCGYPHPNERSCQCWNDE